LTAVRQALFAGLVFDEVGAPVDVTMVGDAPFYVVLDGDFRRHVEAEVVDRQVLEWLSAQISSNRDLVTEGTMSLLGKDDLFTKAMVETSIQDLDAHIEQLMVQGLPEGVKTWLGMLGFQIVVDLHGKVVRLEMPGGGDVEDW
jgi:hypothetical protein